MLGSMGVEEDLHILIKCGFNHVFDENSPFHKYYSHFLTIYQKDSSFGTQVSCFYWKEHLNSISNSSHPLSEEPSSG